MSEGKTELDIEWERRVLCSDGSCIGVIGSDGKCKECGKPYEGELPEVGDFEERVPDEADDMTPEDTVDESVSGAAEDEEAEDIDGEWENRRLCSDGSCIGVIGPDGNCKECGKPFEG